MILSLEKLRRDYKLYRKKDQEIAARIDILLSYSKFELKCQGSQNQEVKVKFTRAFLTSMEISERTIQRWKKDYKERGSEAIQAHLRIDLEYVVSRHKIEKYLDDTQAFEINILALRKKGNEQKRKKNIQRL